MIPGHARGQDMSSGRVAVLLSVNGGVMIFARPVVGLLADSEIIQKRNIIGAFLILGGIFSIMLPWFTGYYPLLVYSITQGLFPGSFFMFIPLLLLEIVPLENLPQAQGLLNLCLSLPVCISQPLPGMRLLYYIDIYFLSLKLITRYFVNEVRLISVHV